MTNKQKIVIEYLKEKLSQREKEIKENSPSYYEIYKTYSLEDKVLDLGGEQMGFAMQKAGYNVYTQTNVVMGTPSGCEWVSKVIKLMGNMPM